MTTLASAKAAAKSASEAKASESSVAANAKAAQTAETNASASAQSAKASETAAKSAQSAAEKARDEAKAIAGGDYANRIHAHQHAVGGEDPITPEMIGAVSRAEWEASLIVPATVE